MRLLVHLEMNKDNLYDHYKDSCIKREAEQSNRNKFFLYSLVCIAGLTVFVALPDILAQAVLAWLNLELLPDMGVIIAVLQSLIWAFLAYVTIRYVQANVKVERDYFYIHQLEEQLGIGRDGENYLNNYPVVLDFIDFFYKKMYPLSLIVWIFAKSVLEWINPNKEVVCCVVDSMIGLFIIALTVLYMAFLHKVSKYYKDPSAARANDC